MTLGASVQFRGVSKTYDGQALVVDGLDLAIHSGEFLTLLGPSGSGKTTTLMMLAGFEVPTSGEINLDGRSLTNVPPYKRSIGMVFQNYALFPHMTVEENLAFPLQARGVSASEASARIRRALEMVQLAEFATRRPAQLSGGQQQRVAVARSLVYQPSLVLMDEPLGALDKQLREQMQLELKHIHQSVGATFVYVTHDQDEALTMSDRVAVFNDGKIQQLDTPEHLYEKPENAFVAQFIGENNRFTGQVEEVSGNLCRVSVDGGVTMLATSVPGLLAGSRSAVSVRPEVVAVDPIDVGYDNRLTTQVLETIYHGDHLRIRVRIAENDQFIVKIPRQLCSGPYEVGQPCEVAWMAHDCRALLDAPE